MRVTQLTKVSIIIPAFNERESISRLIEKVVAVDLSSMGFQKEVIVVDDGSTDGTLNQIIHQVGITVITHLHNQGKGSALKTALKSATGEYILIQDADLEYEPSDYLLLLDLVRKNPKCAVYGSRGVTIYKNQQIIAWIGNRILSFLTLMLYRKLLADTWAGYKVFHRDQLLNLKIRTNRFETDHEITAKLLKKGIKIIEVPVHYWPRSKSGGKKIRWVDGCAAIWTLLRFRFAN